ncbi:MAG TPA: PhzF family phenazine biosynthesis protein [Burkholderiales bacterium]|nr:PhzF family phenazine biosynthesis protein [Burkholderiales bacterium]
MKYRYYICDVFTETRFGGNPLAVLPNADGLSAQQMQSIAREFNFSESTFVFPPQAGQTRRVRIFTPTREIPFAGHPNVGTAFVLAAIGEFGEIRSQTVTFEEDAGLVPISIHADNGRVVRCELAAPQPVSLGKTIAPERIAAAVSLSAADIVTATHAPQVASVGLPFVITELKDRATLGRARANPAAFESLLAEDVRPSLHFYAHAKDGFDVRARMFAPLSGVPEDPATGSATCALAGLLAHYAAQGDATFTWRIAQGVEMGRPSTLIARAAKKAGVVEKTWVGGASVLFSEGVLHLD